jgi:hypothetical protein
MAQVTLPHTSKANTDPNLFSEVKANDQAIIDQVNGNLDATNIAADSIGTSELAANIITQAEVSTTFIASGTYSATITGVTNVASINTPETLQYMRVGSAVTVSGRINNLDVTAASTNTAVGISLPVASNLGSAGDLGGVACADADALSAYAILADITNNRANLQGLSGLSAGSLDYGIHFTYQVI